MRRKLVPVVALAMACLLAATTACSTGNGKERKRQRDTVSERSDSDPPARPSPTATPRRTNDQLTCLELRGARVGSGKVRYRGYAAPIRLADGRWSDRDGTTVQLQRPCAVGDLDGDGADDAIGVLMLDGGGTGRFFTLAVWRGVDGEPVYQAQLDLGDRTPVQSISLQAGRAAVVYLTRSPSSPMAELNIRRSAVYQLKGTTLTKLGHTDARATEAPTDGGGTADSPDDGTVPDGNSPTRKRKSRSR
ncbi:hypothetical protein [Micromonospora sp. KLBMP9576]|uniref:hypothetical protein n=1 Tax=Micromonospora sp. KLBMP9576 TaxID=3424769 RepID=UPI003D8B3C30